MSAKQPNIVFFFWDNLGWGELGNSFTNSRKSRARSMALSGLIPV